jgi:hypothetical protein
MVVQPRIRRWPRPAHQAPRCVRGRQLARRRPSGGPEPPIGCDHSSGREEHAPRVPTRLRDLASGVPAAPVFLHVAARATGLPSRVAHGPSSNPEARWLGHSALPRGRAAVLTPRPLWLSPILREEIIGCLCVPRSRPPRSRRTSCRPFSRRPARCRTERRIPIGASVRRVPFRHAVPVGGNH